ncbi:nucleoside hydrolase [Gorillibacterium sp. sgz5001074]|uniref:nucleoside hydrolase n=1 Tax=Gorillibacterium sp. sgz5001074 TaxID=3446695 RepID=UPI003F670626
MTRKIILDADTGIDDALALAYLAASPEAELLAVTVTYGNTPLSNALRNTIELMKRLQLTVPVYSGAEAPMVRTKRYSGAFHGEDGLGESLGVGEAPPHTPIRASDFIVEQAHRHGKDLTVVTTGPMTNLAEALLTDPSLADKLGGAVCMGGAVAAPGNVTKFAEANVFMDPEAANTVFTSGLPVMLIGLDVTRKTLLTEADTRRWRDSGSGLGRFFADFTAFYLDAYKRHYPYLKGCALHDPLAVGAALHPEWVRTVPFFLHAETDDDSRGRTIENLFPPEGARPNVEVALQVEAEAFMKDFFAKVEGLF